MENASAIRQSIEAADIQPHCVRLMLTGTADFATAQRAVNEIGIFRYLTKPWLDGDLEDHLQAALDQAQWARQQREEAVAWAESQGRISRACPGSRLRGKHRPRILRARR